MRYADDFVVVCHTVMQAEEAWTFVAQSLKALGLELSPEKTKITTYGKGYDFLGFKISSSSRKMRAKSKATSPAVAGVDGVANSGGGVHVVSRVTVCQ